MNTKFVPTILGLLTTVFFLAVSLKFADAQTSAPVMQRAPNIAAWSVIAKSKSGSHNQPKADAGNPFTRDDLFKERTVTKRNGLIHEVTTGWDGRITEEWVVKQTTLRRDPATGQIIVLTSQTNRLAPRFDVTDFKGLDWIEPQFYLRMETKVGEKCLLYEWKAKTLPPAERAKMTSPQELSEAIKQSAGKPGQTTKVWISAATRWPIAMEDDTATYTYKYKPPTFGLLTLPPEFQAAWDQYQKTATGANAHQMPTQQ